ncbi:urease accessory protein UreD [Paenibacillus alkaliterrae]|uniref:urease accessory protein UreD n=1 Tax=Paenibacillus alkaliterrae TaxID=320909 RepID=UPI001F411338|nr:urease accessory protein UreD [Paenibacillus alkaliterrae]MCF2937222.1 urease accessory protein UreD [Paenibacillus alkaliterrae]
METRAESTSQSSEQPARTSVLRVSFANPNGTTIIDNKYHTAPIKIAKAFPLDGQLGVIVMDVSPGLLDGDRYELEWTSGPDSHALITNQSYMKVHPSMPYGGSSMRQTFCLEENAIVEHMPEAMMLYKNAAFHNDAQVRLKSGSVWMQADVLCPGRTLRGEKFDYRCFRNELAVHYGDELIFSQRQRIEPAKQVITAPGCWEDMTHSATFFLFSDRVSRIHLEQLQAKLDSFEAPAGHSVIAGVSMTYRHGLSVMAASTAAWPLQQLMRELWSTARAGLLGKPPLRFLQG